MFGKFKGIKNPLDISKTTSNNQEDTTTPLVAGDCLVECKGLSNIPVIQNDTIQIV